jgi:hypothetical protein
MELVRTTQRITANPLAGTNTHGNDNAIKGDNSLHLGLLAGKRVVYLVSIRLHRRTTAGGSTTIRRIPTLAHPTTERSCVAIIVKIKTSKVAYAQSNTEARSHKPLLPWKSSKQYFI